MDTHLKISESRALSNPINRSAQHVVLPSPPPRQIQMTFILLFPLSNFLLFDQHHSRWKTGELFYQSLSLCAVSQLDVDSILYVELELFKAPLELVRLRNPSAMCTSSSVMLGLLHHMFKDTRDNSWRLIPKKLHELSLSLTGS